MKSRSFLAVAGVFLLLALSCGDLLAVDLATVNGKNITAEDFLRKFQVVAAAGDAPERTPEGKREFLDGLIMKELLSQHFHARGWDTVVSKDPNLDTYRRSQYLQSLYYEAIPESRALRLGGLSEMMEKSKAYVDSLEKSYDLTLDEKVIIFVADRSMVLRTGQGREHGQPRVSWRDLFTDEENKMVAAKFLGGQLTIGEFVEAVEQMPPFARPTGGDSDAIAVTLEHFGRNKIFEHEFYKLGLENQPFFLQKMKEKGEEWILTDLFAVMQDTVRVTRDEVREYYEAHRDNYITVTTVKLAFMTFGSEEVAQRAAQRVSEGEEFESVAVDFSVYSTSEAGYDTTGFVDRGKMQELFDAAWEQEIGATVGPVSYQGDWAVVKLLGRRDPRLLTLEEATPMVVERIKFLTADMALAASLEELRSGADIYINYDALDALEIP